MLTDVDPDRPVYSRRHIYTALHAAGSTDNPGRMNRNCYLPYSGTRQAGAGIRKRAGEVNQASDDSATFGRDKNDADEGNRRQPRRTRVARLTRTTVS